MSKTTIAVSDELADELYRRKGRGESYEDVIWRLIDDSRETAPADDLESESHTESHREPPREPIDDRRDEPTEADAADDEKPTDELEVAIAALDVPGSGGAAELKRDAVRATYDYLVEHGEIQKSIAQDEVYPDSDGGYETADGWWNMVQPRLKGLPGTVKSGNRWLYRDPDDE